MNVTVLCTYYSPFKERTFPLGISQPSAAVRIFAFQARFPETALYSLVPSIILQRFVTNSQFARISAQLTAVAMQTLIVLTRVTALIIRLNLTFYFALQARLQAFVARLSAVN